MPRGTPAPAPARRWRRPRGQARRQRPTASDRARSSRSASTAPYTASSPSRSLPLEGGVGEREIHRRVGEAGVAQSMTPRGEPSARRAGGRRCRSPFTSTYGPAWRAEVEVVQLRRLGGPVKLPSAATRPARPASASARSSGAAPRPSVNRQVDDPPAGRAARAGKAPDPRRRRAGRHPATGPLLTGTIGAPQKERPGVVRRARLPHMGRVHAPAAAGPQSGSTGARGAGRPGRSRARDADSTSPTSSTLLSQPVATSRTVRRQAGNCG
jgi:hypothetical protein